MIPAPALLPLSVTAEGTVSGGETVLFWVLAPVMVIASLGLIFARKAVYAAMSVVLVMICLAFLYAAQEAPFLAVAQVVVYTGAIMMLFLFVLMLVGVDASDSLVETIKGQRWVAGLAGLGLVLVLVGVAVSLGTPEAGTTAQGLAEANADTNPVGVARLIFADHVLAMELTGALLITAAVGALTYTHRERLTQPKSQRATVDDKMRAYAARGSDVAPLPSPGVYARSNAADLPALSGTGEPIEESVPRVLRIRGQQRTIGEVSPETVAAMVEAREGTGPGVHGPAANRAVQQSGQPHMPGEAPPPAPPTTSTDVQTRGEADR